MSFQPCLNPHCKSEGKPHPNCKCYSGMAEGGHVKRYCSEAKEHLPGCQYFKDGGEVINPADVIIDQPHASTEEINPDDVQIEGQAPQQEEINPEDVVVQGEEPKFDDPMERTKAIAEGASRGFLSGPVANLAEEHLLGVNPEDIAARERRYPVESGVAELGGLAAGSMTGMGVLGLTTKALGALKLARLGQVGATVARGALTAGIVQGLDEKSKMMLGLTDPQDGAGAALAHIGAATLIGGVVPGALKTLSISRAGAKLSAASAGIAAASENATGARKPVDDAVLDALSEQYGESETGLIDAYRKGQEFYDKNLGSLLEKLPAAIGSIYAKSKGYAAAEGAIFGGWIGKLTGLDKVLSGISTPVVQKILTPFTLKIISANNANGIIEALGHAENIGNGYGKLVDSVESLFNIAPFAPGKVYDTLKDKEELDQKIKDGGINYDLLQQSQDQSLLGAPPRFAHGGHVSKEENPQALVKNDDGLAIHYPEQNIIMNQAKGRISNYLGSLRPQEHMPKLAFDAKPNSKEQQRSYSRALDIALRPMSVLDKVRDGSLEPEHMKHFTSMFPEVNSLLMKKLTERISKAQMDGEKPTYKVRQGLSMFMGAALSGEFLPQNIVAAQQVFQRQQQAASPQQGQQTAAPKKNKQSLAKSSQAFLTGSQALVSRQQRT